MCQVGAAFSLFDSFILLHMFMLLFTYSHKTDLVYSYIHTYLCILTLPYLTSGVDRLLHLPSAEAVSARPNACPRM